MGKKEKKDKTARMEEQHMDEEDKTGKILKKTNKLDTFKVSATVSVS